MRWQPVSQPFVGKHACVQFCGRNHKFVTILTFRKLFYKLFFTPSFCSFVMQLAYKINNIPGPLGICETKILYSKCSIIKTVLAVILSTKASTHTHKPAQVGRVEARLLPHFVSNHHSNQITLDICTVEQQLVYAWITQRGG